MKLFTYSIPKLIKRNNFDEHIFLMPCLFLTIFLFLMILKSLNINNTFSATICFLVPISYYVYLIFNIINNDYYFDLKELDLSEDAKNFILENTNVYNDEIRFFLHSMNPEFTSKFENPKSIFIEIDAALKKAKDKEIREVLLPGTKQNLISVLLCHSYGHDMNNLDKEFIRLFIENVDISLNAESREQLKELEIII